MKRLMILLVIAGLLSATQAAVIWKDGCSSLSGWTEDSLDTNEAGDDTGAILVSETSAVVDVDGKEFWLSSWSGASEGTYTDIWTNNPVGVVQAEMIYTLTVKVASWDDGIEGTEIGAQPLGAYDQIYISMYDQDMYDFDETVMAEEYVWPMNDGDSEGYTEYSVSFSTVAGENSAFVGKEIYVWVSSNDWWNNFSVSEMRITDSSPIPNKAYLPSPPDGADEIPFTTTLTWEAAGDPNVITHKVYLGKTADWPGSLLADGVEIPVGTEIYDPNGSLVLYDTEYSWRIDEICHPASGPDYTLSGDVWSFTSVGPYPIFTDPNLPRDVFFAPGDPPVSMTVSAREAIGGGTSNLTYQWYDSDGPLFDNAVISGSTGSGASSTLTFTGANISYADDYYCVVTDTNESLSTASNTAVLEMPRLYAHLTFEADTVDTDSGLINDIVSGYETWYEWDTDSGGPITFGPGCVGDQAVVLEDIRKFSGGGGPIDDDEWVWMGEELLDPVAANGGKQISITLWAYLSETTPARQALFSALDPAWDVNLGIYCPTQNGGSTVRFEDSFGAESVEWTFPDANELPGQWLHFAFTKNVDTGDMKIYLNGDLKNTTNAALADIKTTGHIGLFLGAHTNYNESFTGSIDDFRMYNYALSDTEVTYIYECPAPPSYDLDADCDVDLGDLAVMAELWLNPYDMTDMAGLSGEWLTNK